MSEPRILLPEPGVYSAGYEYVRLLNFVRQHPEKSQATPSQFIVKEYHWGIGCLYEIDGELYNIQNNYDPLRQVVNGIYYKVKRTFAPKLKVS